MKRTQTSVQIENSDFYLKNKVLFEPESVLLFDGY